MNDAVAEGVAEGCGLGEAIGAYLRKGNKPNLSYSMLSEAYRLGIPVTVHIAMGRAFREGFQDIRGPHRAVGDSGRCSAEYWFSRYNAGSLSQGIQRSAQSRRTL